MSTSQPRWKVLYATDYSRLLVDTAGVYSPELEIAQDLGDGTFEVSRVCLDRCKQVRGYLVPASYQDDYPHPLPDYQEWFADDLASVAESHGTTEGALREALCSEKPEDRAFAYECIGGHLGYDNFDSDPLLLNEDELDARWEKDR